MLSAALAAAAIAFTPAGGYTGPQPHGPAAAFRVGAAGISFSPPRHGALGRQSSSAARTPASASAGRAVAVAVSGGRVVHPRMWMSLSGLPQRHPDRDTRGYIDARGRRVWVDVY